MATVKTSEPDTLYPLAADGRTRLRFPMDEIEVLSGDISRRSITATIRVDGRVYSVTPAPCGLGCHCDAIAVDITDRKTIEVTITRVQVTRIEVPSDFDTTGDLARRLTDRQWDKLDAASVADAETLSVTGALVEGS